MIIVNYHSLTIGGLFWTWEAQQQKARDDKVSIVILCLVQLRHLMATVPVPWTVRV